MFQDCSVFVGLKSGAIDVLNIVTEDQIMFAENKINNNGKIFFKMIMQCNNSIQK